MMGYWECMQANVGMLGVYSGQCWDAGSVFMPLLGCWECILNNVGMLGVCLASVGMLGVYLASVGMLGVYSDQCWNAGSVF